MEYNIKNTRLTKMKLYNYNIYRVDILVYVQALHLILFMKPDEMTKFGRVRGETLDCTLLALRGKVMLNSSELFPAIFS